MSQEHANSYAVDTGGYKQVMADLTGHTGYRSKTTQLKVLTEAVAQLQERVIALENQNKMLQAHLKMQAETIQKWTDRVRNNKVEHNKLANYVYGPLQTFEGSQAEKMDAHTEAIEALQKVVLRIPGPRAKDQR